ncbi:MAG: hypothetical protein IAG13_08540 [Deltaproteobacteria bacterium]|nr:hypothetical protein [Nannocystaceae bacterium]
MVGLLQWRGWSCTAITIALLGCGPAVDVDDDGSSSDADDATGSAQDGGTSNAAEAEADSANDEATGMPIPFDLGGPSSALSGEYLFALAAVIDPGHPFQFHARVVAEDDASGGAILEIMLQPLALDVLSTNAPRTPVGDPIPIVIGVGPDGEFGAELPELRVTGAANPITGSDLVATVGLRGSTDDGDVWCGDAYGTVTQPLTLDLVGSTFSFTRLDGDVLPDPVIAFCQR